MLNEFGIEMDTAGRAIISLKLKREQLLGRLAIETEDEEALALRNWLTSVEALTARLSATYLNQ